MATPFLDLHLHYMSVCVYLHYMTHTHTHTLYEYCTIKYYYDNKPYVELYTFTIVKY